MSAIPLKREIEYPSSDGQPMAETQLHQRVIIDLLHALKVRYESDPRVWLGGDLLLYYVQGNPEACVVPDVFVTKGAGKGERDTYLLWEEGKAPDLVFEIVSKTSRSRDRLPKKTIYEGLNIEEYVVFDPLKDHIDPRLQGFRLAGGRYRPIPREPDGSLLLRTIGLKVRTEGDNLRLIDAVTDEPLLWEMEDVERANREAMARQAAEERAAREATARQAAEDRARALEEELERLRRRLENDPTEG